MADFKPRYRRCFKCEQREKCNAMCVDVCWDECVRIEAIKQLKRDDDLNQFEQSRAHYLAVKSGWARVQQKRRGY